MMFEPTTHYWQSLHLAEELKSQLAPPYKHSYPALLPDGRYLLLPLRHMPTDKHRSVASFIANHAALSVIDVLSGFMVEQVSSLDAEIILGLPTLGLTFAPKVAEKLGFNHYVPLGYSRKYWYDEDLSVPVASITSPTASKRLYIDPHIVPRLESKRVVMIDDVISSGQTMLRGLELMKKLNVQVVGMVLAMAQGERWKAELNSYEAGLATRVRVVFSSPRMILKENGWWPE